ncbi:hypothetical protein FB451DRAFT_1203972 [Mycena latifolia]|nr:hypothetical protein FB451DRAFT_1203972 [Mycena latifolia]
MDTHLEPAENFDSEMADVVQVERLFPLGGEETLGKDPPSGASDSGFQLPYLPLRQSGAEEVKRSTSEIPVLHPRMGGKTIWNTIPQSQEDSTVDPGPSTQSSDCFEDATAISPTPKSEEWEDSEDESEIQDAMDAPSTDIRGDFERVLNKPLDFQGSYYFHKTYSDFPNPILRLGALGHIGLPLSSREAKHVIAHCVQAPFGKGERTLVDKSVRDTWEMDASQVHFDNPDWKTFMGQIRQEVCLKLGLAAQQISTVRCEPYKLLLYETGSHTEKAKGMFATVVVVLPSPFQGGAAHLSHGDLTAVIESSSHSLSKVSVLAWYTDVFHEIKPITGGHRLAITFNLIQTQNSRPELPQTTEYLSRLRHVLLSWKQQANSAEMPGKLMYLLQHKYSLASLRGDCLKGADAYKVALLQTLAKQLTFDVGLANVECHVVGAGDDDFGHRGGYGSEDDEDVGMAEVFEQTMTISNLVYLNGQRIQEEVECEDDSEFCPLNLREEVEAGNPDEREYEGYQGNGAGSLELWYRRTVLVIWPHHHNAEMKYGTDPDRALAVLASTGEPDHECRLLTRFLLRGIESQRFGHDTIRGLCKTACHWKNLALWLKTISLCDRTKVLDILSARRIVEAIEVFGFDERMQDVLDSIILVTPSNTARIKLLGAIMAKAGTDRVDNNWLARQRYRVMKTLNKPLLGEEDLLVKLSVEGGGVPFLQSTILPQVVAMADAAFFVAFAKRLVTEQSLLQTGDFISATRNIVRDLLELAIERTDFFASVSNDGHPSPALAHSFIEACVKCSHTELTELVIDKLVASSDVSADTARTRTSHVLIPLIAPLSASDRPIPGLVKLCRFATEQYVKQACTPATDAEVAAVLEAVVAAKDSSILPKIVDRLSYLPNEALCWSLIKNLRSREGSIIFDAKGGISISTLCMQPVQNLVQRTQYGSDLPLIVRHLQLCLATNDASVLLHLFPRLLSPAVTNKRYISDVLLPLVPKIQNELVSRKVSSTSEPFRTVFKQIFELYAYKVLGLPPSSDHSSLLKGVKKLDCTCVNCTAVVKFFLQSQDRQLKLTRIGKEQRKHVEQKLGKFVGYRTANWGIIKTTTQGLELKEALGVVSKDKTVLQDIFGDDVSYRKFVQCMEGESTEPEAGPSQPPAKRQRIMSESDVIDLCSP